MREEEIQSKTISTKIFIDSTRHPPIEVRSDSFLVIVFVGDLSSCLPFRFDLAKSRVVCLEFALEDS